MTWLKSYNKLRVAKKTVAIIMGRPHNDTSAGRSILAKKIPKVEPQ